MNVNPADKGKDSKSIDPLSQRKSFDTQREDNKNSDCSWAKNKEECEECDGEWDDKIGKCGSLTK